LKDIEQSLPLQDAVPSSALDAGLHQKSDHTMIPLQDLRTSELVHDGDSSQEKNEGVVGEVRSSLANSSESIVSYRGSFADTNADSIPSDRGAQYEEGVRNPLLVPSFGEFLDLQVLPLYVADVPFHRLKCLTETHCGISLDSDDEQDAWDAVGLTKPVVTKTPRKKRRRTLHGESSLEQSSEQPPSHTKLMELCDLMGKSKAKLAVPVMRAQMQTSIVEKRRSNIRAFRDTDGHSNAHTEVPRVPLPSPLVKTARALLQGSTPLSAAFASQKIVYPDCSPLSVRKTSRGRLDLQASSRSTHNSRTPKLMRQPDWDVM